MIIPWQEFTPLVPASAFVADGAMVIGRVTLGEDASIWYNVVARGDINEIRIGDRTNIQDLSVIHVGDEFPCIIGNDVTVGHAARLHGCTIRDGALIGIGAVVLNGAVVGEEALVAAGALVPEGMVLDAGWLYMGSPAKPRRALSPEERERNRFWAGKYMKVARSHREIIPPDQRNFGL